MDKFKADYKLKDICIADLISDDYLISLVLNIKDNDSTLGFKNFRNFKMANVKEMIRDMNPLDCNGNSLDEVLTSFNNNVQKALDKHVQEKRVKLSLKNSKPWYNDDLRQLHRDVRIREMIWRKYQEEHQSLAFKEKQHMYIKHLYISRQEYLRKEIAGLQGNTKHLYKLNTELMGTVTENPLSECENDEELANRFPNFFVDKIQKNQG